MVGGDPGPQYNLARNWTHWGHGGPAGVGAVVVWPHHVGKIVGQQDGMWIIESGNDGHRWRAPSSVDRRRGRHPLGMTERRQLCRPGNRAAFG